MARFSLTDTLICGCEGLYTCQLHLWALCVFVYLFVLRCVFAPYRGPCRQHEAAENRACSCKQHPVSSPSLGWWCHSSAPLLESLDCFHCLGSHSLGSGVQIREKRRVGEGTKYQRKGKRESRAKSLRCPVTGWTLVQLEALPSLESPRSMAGALKNHFRSCWHPEI